MWLLFGGIASFIFCLLDSVYTEQRYKRIKELLKLIKKNIGKEKKMNNADLI